MTQNWKTEFPDMTVEEMPAIPEGWEDVSWHNDSCPSFQTPSGFLVFVDFEDPQKRDFPEVERFSASKCDAEGAVNGPSFASENWDEILQHVKG